MQDDLKSILKWTEVYSPQTLLHLNPPASEAAIIAVERAIGVELPVSYKSMLGQFNGEGEMSSSALLGDGHQLLSCERILEVYVTGGDETNQKIDDVDVWRELASSEIIFIKGPVKPLSRHPLWVPMTSMNGDVLRFLDYDPAPGGVAGQLIEVDAECCVHKVLAPSFEAFLQSYANDLAGGLFTVDEEGDIQSMDVDDPSEWGVPAWLNDTP